MYKLGLYEKAMGSALSLEEKLLLARRAGFDFVELSIDESDEKLARLEMPRSARKQLSDTILDAGIGFGSICLSGHRKYPLGSRDEKTRARSLDIMRRAIDLSCDLGVRLIQLAGYDVYYEEGGADTEAYFSENLAKCVEYAAASGVLLGFETMETPFMDTVEKAMRYVSEMNSPYLAVYPDVGNLNNAALKYGESVTKDLEKGKGRIVAAHLKETIQGKYRDMFYGDGAVDFDGITKKLKELCVSRYVGEFWDDGKGNSSERLKRANEFLRSKLDRA